MWGKSLVVLFEKRRGVFVREPVFVLRVEAHVGVEIERECA